MGVRSVGYDAAFPWLLPLPSFLPFQNNFTQNFEFSLFRDQNPISTLAFFGMCVRERGREGGEREREQVRKKARKIVSERASQRAAGCVLAFISLCVYAQRTGCLGGEDVIILCSDWGMYVFVIMLPCNFDVELCAFICSRFYYVVM